MLSYRGVTQEQLPPQQPAQTPQLVICPELVDLLREMVTAQTTVVIEEREQQKQIAGPGMKEEPGAAGAETTGAGAQDTGQPGNFERVRAYLAENPKAKIREVSEALTISMSTASKHMNKVRGK